MTEEVIESAKAVQEAAKATGHALEIVSKTGGWLGQVFGEPIAEAIGLLVTDKIKARRAAAAIYDAANLEALAREVRQSLDGRDVNLRHIPASISIPLLEEATREYEPKLRQLWARLLATAIDDSADPVERKFISILSDLSAADADAVRLLWAEFEVQKARGAIRDTLVRYGPSIEPDDYVGASLRRLGLIEAASIEIQLYEPAGERSYSDYGPTVDWVSVPTEPRFAVFSDLGKAFCKAVGLNEA